MKQNLENLRHCFVTTPLFIFGCRDIAAKVWLGAIFLIKKEMSFSKSLLCMINSTNKPLFYFYLILIAMLLMVFIFAMLTIKIKYFMSRSRYVNTFCNKFFHDEYK